MDRKIASETFWSTFLGEFVEILAEVVTPGAKVPLTINAYLLDIDNDYFYLGQNPIEINSCIKRSDVSYIEIIKQEDEATSLLKNTPVPENENEVN